MSKLITNKDIISVLDHSHDGCMISDGNGKILYFNEAYDKLTHYAKKIETGKNIREYVTSGYINESGCLKAINERKLVMISQVYPNRTSLMVAAKPIFGLTGNIIFVVTHVRDITEFYELRNDIENVEKMLKESAKELKQKNLDDEGIVAVSDKMQATIKMARAVSKVDITVLIQGESGTGKDVVANYIHRHSARKSGPFIEINCGAIPESLLETELFGYKGGSFTGGLKEGKKGLLHSANGGTLFLDEIGDMPLSLQVKLLRVLENRSYVPVGGSKTENVDIRFIAATNKNLAEMIVKGTFREDLFYRLNVVSIEVDPLRDRIDDIVPLCLYFLEYYNKKYNLNKKMTPKALNQLKHVNWKGNVRELRNKIEMLTIISEGNEIEVMQDEVQNHDTSQDAQIQQTLAEYMDTTERDFLIKARKQFITTRQMAAELGVNHSTIMRKLKKYGINAIK